MLFVPNVGVWLKGLLLQGIDAEYVSLENIVPEYDEDADGADDGTLDQEFYDKLAAAIGERIEQCGSRVPVVTGTFIRFVKDATLIMFVRFLWPCPWLTTSPSWARLHRSLFCPISSWFGRRRTADLERGRWYFYRRSTKSAYSASHLDHFSR